MLQYKLVERNATPGVKNSTEKKFYATPKTNRALGVRTFAKLATADASMSVGDMENALDLFGRTALQQLLQGHSVEIPDIGSLRISFHSEGVIQPEDFRSQKMISNPRIVFTPKPEVRAAIRTGIGYELAGVRAGGHDYTSVAEYRSLTGTAPTASQGGTTPSGGGETPSGGGGTTPDPNPGGDGIE